MAVLMAEDSRMSALLLKRILEKGGFEVVMAADGVEALEAARKQPFEAVLTDMMMPNLDGVGLIAALRSELAAVPPLLVVTVLDNEEELFRALAAGADDYLRKPYDPLDVVARVRTCIARKQHAVPEEALAAAVVPASPPAFSAVGIVASTGASSILMSALAELDPNDPAAYLLVLPWAQWALDAFAKTMKPRAKIAIAVATPGETLAPGRLYLLPADKHLRAVEGARLEQDDRDPLNHARPSADLLFASLAETFGPRAVAVVLSGLGCDGARGAAQIARAGGRVIVQSPTTAVDPTMPQNVLALAPTATEAQPPDLGAILRAVTRS